MDQELTDALFDRSIIAKGDPVPGDEMWPYEEFDDVKPKFDSVAAAIMWAWSMDSGQDEDCGDAQLGNGWHALFRDERAILHTDSSGFVSAWRIENGKDVDTEWEEIEKGAVYMDDMPDDDVDTEDVDPACTANSPHDCDGTYNN